MYGYSHQQSQRLPTNDDRMAIDPYPAGPYAYSDDVHGRASPIGYHGSTATSWPYNGYGGVNWPSGFQEQAAAIEPNYDRISAPAYDPFYDYYSGQNLFSGGNDPTNGVTPLPPSVPPAQYGLPPISPAHNNTGAVPGKKPNKVYDGDIRAERGAGPGGSVDGAVSRNDGGGSGGGDKVICQELVDQGRLSPSLYAYDKAYAATLPTHLVAGYQLWAKPLVKWMRRSPAFSRLLAVPATAWAQAAAHKMGPTHYPDHRLGRLIMTLGEPLCAAIGRCFCRFPAGIVKSWR